MANAFEARTNMLSKETGRGPLAPLEGNTYDFKRTTYPLEGMGTEVPSYIIFYINLPDTAKYTGGAENIVKDATSTSNQNVDLSRGGNASVGLGSAAGVGVQDQAVQIAARAATPNVALGDILPSMEQLGGAVRVAAAGTAVAALARKVEKKPKTLRIKEAIAIYMPDTVMHTYSHDYDRASMTDAMGRLGEGQRALSVMDSEGAGGTEVMAKAAVATGQVGKSFTDFALRSKARTVNPQIEMMYRGSQNRSFILEFRFQPRNEKERDAIQDIIFLFRRYAAPDLAEDGYGSYFIPPGEFDIQYYFKNEENKYIGRISTCVLQNIDVNYASAGQWATFADGQPVEILVTLRFAEVDIITRGMVDAGF